MANPLHELISLSQKERAEKGVQYTPKEIELQPKMWIKNFEMLRRREKEIRSFISSKILSKRSSKVVLSGAGSSFFVGLSSQNLLRHRWNIDVDARPTTDIVTHWGSILLRK